MNTMTVHEAAIVLGVSETTVRRWFHADILKGTQDYATKEIMIRRSSVSAKLDGITEKQYLASAREPVNA